MAAKKTPTRKATPKKAATGTRKATPKKAATGTRKATPKKAAGTRKTTPKEAATGTRKATPKKAAGFSSQQVNLGHVFALRPRVRSSFRQEDFLSARRDLADEGYDSIEAAARAVAERALSLSNDPKGRQGRRGGR